ncbi:virulence factor TspB C-terminal domain-related protein [Kingella kingae]|nr:virulence factor TspB C-terminal domain-related protein [Kingella kingae]MDK4529093.1 virulence factor TspB C-terminal domain-related protein [Kingella kingae]MDK4564365.1 virulence factor TspB C-terminal domain-related protein [Kingella kingae]MDK4579056.1 virulence factor TspB C-terminal domain-related protein [Kingella kingae]MDK4627395.1 virulence factor TspB C-terminal domain-related protein [Kingella kingae]MDK4675137.1 virulence factor TspB C-terminal domain-related protein [Kingella
MRSVHYLFNAVITTFCLFFVSLSHALIPENGGGGGGGTATVIGGGGLSGIGGAFNSGGAAAAAAAGFAPGATAPSSSNGTTGKNTGATAGAAAGAAMGDYMNGKTATPSMGRKPLTQDDINRYQAMLDNLFKVYVSLFNDVAVKKAESKKDYENSVAHCLTYYAGAHEVNSRRQCVKASLENFEKYQKYLDDLLVKHKAAYDESLAELEAAFQKEFGFNMPTITNGRLPSSKQDAGVNVTGATDVITDSNGNKMCKINGTWQPCGGVGVGPDAVSNDTVVGTATDINGNKICKINGTWQPCGGVGVGPDAISGGTVGIGTNTGTGTATNSGTGTNSGTSTNTAAGTTANSTTTSNTTNSTTNNINNTTVPNIKFEDLNDFADYCKANPEAVVCMKMDKEVPDTTGILNDFISKLKENGENAPKFVLNNLFGSGVGTCPAPLKMNAMGYQIGLSFDAFCEFLRLIRPLIIALSWLTTGFFVLSGIKS